MLNVARTADIDHYILLVKNLLHFHFKLISNGFLTERWFPRPFVSRHFSRFMVRLQFVNGLSKMTFKGQNSYDSTYGLVSLQTFGPVRPTAHMNKVCNSKKQNISKRL